MMLVLARKHMGSFVHSTAEKSLRLFAKEALPALQSWKSDAIASFWAE